MDIYRLMEKLNLSNDPTQPMPENMTVFDLILGKYATNEAKNRFPDSQGEVGGEQDAFRHLVWQANLQRNMPFAAKLIGDLHETRIPYIGNPLQGKSEREMDIYNNDLGRKIADQATSNEDVYRIAEEFVRGGRAKTVPYNIINQEYGRKY